MLGLLATLGAAAAPEVRVDVRPWVTVRASRRRVVVRHASARLVRGSTVVVQRRAADGSWRGVAARTPDARGAARFGPLRRGAVVRAYVRAREGVHAEAWSTPLRVG
ncbi:MAG: hypothetical protein ICV64_09890 [Thermoleophilia bacterium]|nr:hypothetical protein [Thermoleophilia bacterium]